MLRNTPLRERTDTMKPEFMYDIAKFEDDDDDDDDYDEEDDTDDDEGDFED